MGWSPTFWTVGNDILTGHLDKQDEGSATGGLDAVVRRVYLAFFSSVGIFFPHRNRWNMSVRPNNKISPMKCHTFVSMFLAAIYSETLPI